MKQHTLTLPKPDDMHLHLRDNEVMECVLPFSSQMFGRAIIMPNLDPPITNCKTAFAYKNRIIKAIPFNQSFEPLMTFYLTEKLCVQEIRKGVDENLVQALKLYPAGATTNSHYGVKNVKKIYPILEELCKLDLPLLVHGEVVDRDVDVFDREKVFIDNILIPLTIEFPELRIVFEHITTAEGVDFVSSANSNLAATITAHHLALNRNAIFAGGINPHNYCLPILKRERHRLALLRAAVSGNQKFFLGTDSAPHLKEAKESCCGCAGVFSSPNAIGVVTTLFDDMDRLEHLVKFISLNGCNFYKLSPNKDCIVITKKLDPVISPTHIHLGKSSIKVFDPGFDIHWHVDAGLVA